MDALLGNSAEKSAELKKKARQMLQFSEGPDGISSASSAVKEKSASDRLKASFSRNALAAPPSDNSDTSKGVQVKKRPKRVKPAAAKKKSK